MEAMYFMDTYINNTMQQIQGSSYENFKQGSVDYLNRILFVACY